MIDPDSRRVVIALLARGLVTLAEARELAGVSRQLLAHWVKRSGVDARRVRHAVIAKHWRREMRNEASHARLPSKAALRKRAERAKADWDKAHRPRQG